MERLTTRTLDSILSFARRGGLTLFIDSDGELKGYPKTSRVFAKVQEMLVGRHPEMKIHMIRTMRGEAE